jgi:hypothetical protein
LGNHDKAAPVYTVGNDAPDERKGQDRQSLGQAGKAEMDRGVGQLVNLPDIGCALDLLANSRDDQRDIK